MNYTDLKDKNLNELQVLLKEKKVLLFELKAKLKTMQLTNTSELRATKKDIARIQTAITAAKAN
ncbi:MULTISPECIES: 50S ribosomal protein L29 [Arcobacter]|jgi:large subunit ribosomal protein L29|uniref:Large ribosomal subunit protein uL29 n=2 Tax=Arcobacter TaxID=28196 RepID=A0A4V1LVE4_9BACT|nr:MULTISPECIES: 50S ribosomal protein L29 [Arcobacter]MCB9096180.1 50S ribosomal protein L29 [Arcobacter sp.]NCB13466.1 50S ribosomal protein L29 [Erysipelotrichia bacterium]QKE25565.1 50S ribosomal protein L29 [Arcobacter aquimarinus]QKF89389.1 50S ribosomal protein L29 [Arcobacter cloacae]RXI30058.1 50S ribosomal protein L29 [Arcobacter aquimarinus]